MKPFAAALFAASAILAAPAFAQTPPPAAPAQPPAAECSPAVSAVLGTWDTGMAAAEKFGEKATALAREKGREYLLPLLGIDPKTVPPAAPGANDTTDDVARAVEASRNDPARRAALCAAVTQAMNEARDKAGAGLDALKRAVEGWQLPQLPGQSPNPAPTPAPVPGDPTQTQGQPLIKT